MLRVLGDLKVRVRHGLELLHRALGGGDDGLGDVLGRVDDVLDSVLAGLGDLSGLLLGLLLGFLLGLLHLLEDALVFLVLLTCAHISR